MRIRYRVPITILIAGFILLGIGWLYVEKHVPYPRYNKFQMHLDLKVKLEINHYNAKYTLNAAGHLLIATSSFLLMYIAGFLPINRKDAYRTILAVFGFVLILGGMLLFGLLCKPVLGTFLIRSTEWPYIPEGLEQAYYSSSIYFLMIGIGVLLLGYCGYRVILDSQKLLPKLGWSPGKFHIFWLTINILSFCMYSSCFLFRATNLACYGKDALHFFGTFAFLSGFSFIGYFLSTIVLMHNRGNTGLKRKKIWVSLTLFAVLILLDWIPNLHYGWICFASVDVWKRFFAVSLNEGYDAMSFAQVIFPSYDLAFTKIPLALGMFVLPMMLYKNIARLTEAPSPDKSLP